jgi:alpha-L-fucosidase
MKSVTLSLVLALGVCHPGPPAQAGPYEASWGSLDQRPTPQWWQDARFGIFVFWGPAAVPAYSPRGEYAEWYWHWIERADARGRACREFHDRVYGEDFEYADFLPLFRGELFDPEEWADLFEASGAKYVVLNAKHHDGFTMWPSREANTSWGRRWNSLEAGPRRDVVGEVSAAVRKKGIRFGVYYSLYEWFNPLFVSDVGLFVDKVYHPQVQDLVTRYRPEIIFADGEWDFGSDVWRSHELLAWLFNDSPVAQQVVVNDRWFKGSRHRHGGYYTTEYGSGLEGAAHPWEENRAIGRSYGYNRAERAEDYSSARELVLMLVDIVSRGGNLLLDVGPAADGRIPEIMQDRLLKMGRWLETNGEAIYGTRGWKRSCQWSEGTVVEAARGEFKTGYDILRLTLTPREGEAVKEVFFTRKKDTLYAITPTLPVGELVIEDVIASEESEASLLGFETTLSWRQTGNDVVVRLPELRESWLPSDLAFVFRLTHASP